MPTNSLDRDRIIAALARLAELLRERGIVGEICLLGGTVMVLAFKARAATKDVDAIFSPQSVVRELAQIVGNELGLPEGWLNDGAKGFVSSNHEVVAGDLPQFDQLRVVAPTAEYMLAMKCMAARIASGAGEPDDLSDIEFLLRHLHLRSVDATLEVIGRFYPAATVPVRTRYVLEDLLGGTA